MNQASAAETSAGDAASSADGWAVTSAEDPHVASTRVRVSLTDRCNFKCFFCHNEGQASDVGSALQPQHFRRLAGAFRAAGIKSVKITGGEPLLYRNNGYGASDIVRAIREAYGTDELDLSITTNGWLLTRQIGDLMEAGLKRVTVSLSTLNEATHRSLIHGRGGKPATIVNAIRNAIDSGLAPVKVNTVFFGDSESGPGNIDELPDIVKQCRDIGVSELRLYPILGSSRNSELDERYKYWDPATVSVIRNALASFSTEAEVDHASAILQDVANGKYDDIAARSRFTLFIPAGPNFRIALNMMSAFRSPSRHCTACQDPYACQEGMYALRMSASGEFRVCLNSQPFTSTDVSLLDRASDEDIEKTIAAARQEFVIQHSK